MNIAFSRQRNMPVIWEGEPIKSYFRIDLILQDSLILELKAGEGFNELHVRQLSTYLKIADVRLGMIINFNSPLMKNGIKRVVNTEISMLR